MTVRAARRVEARRGRPVRQPRLPHAGEDREVVEQAEAEADAQAEADLNQAKKKEPS